MKPNVKSNLASDEQSSYPVSQASYAQEDLVQGRSAFARRDELE